MRTLGVLVIDDESDYVAVVVEGLERRVVEEDLGPVKIITALHPGEGREQVRGFEGSLSVIAIDGMFPGLTLHRLCGVYIASFAKQYRQAAIIANSASVIYAAAMRQAGCTTVCVDKERLPRCICNQLRLIREADRWTTEVS
jgi:CheY-like chemotaxis protein